ncbi:MAG: hypothetical protein ABI867_27830 [Kofleriaceae bacterium]
MRVIIVAMCLVIAGLNVADACGYWRMSDKEKKREIGWLINSGEIKNDKAKRVGAIYLDIEAKGGIKAVTGKTVVFDVKDSVLRRYGKPIGSIAVGAITIGKQVYTVELSNRHLLHEMPAWDLAVKRGSDVIVVSTDASALCAALDRARTGRTMTDDEQQDEIRLRVAYYLASRDVGM